ncbi:amino acid adenylation domain-containing protein [Actinoplanes sp. NPDC024001]|uniref:non-ribosomal peptide synthetase/type I polyketide synthase n=1 Tax=Actinoplanes sp. NPDC024001 TaxID=3154598 RepID=UPI0033D84BCB
MTLTEVLVRAAADAPGQGVVHVGGDGAERFTSYAELYADALRIAGGLMASGLGKGDPLLIVAEDSTEFLPLFWGAVLAGAVPVPLPPEPARVAAVQRLLDGAPVAADSAAFRAAPPLTEPVPVGPDDLALLQFSSGSTGTPKGVELTHGNLAANVEQARQASAGGPDDVVVTWMPYFHDMGLIGTHLTPLHLRCKQVRISPLTFAKRPEVWLRAAARHRGTILSAANFALALTVRRVPGPVLDDLDLSSVRLVMVGAEPISPAVWRAFAAHLGRARLDPHALQPVYGLAEATVAVACPPMGELARPHRLSRAALARGVALDAGPDVPAVAFMDVGHPLPGCALRIVDDSGEPVEDGLVGHIQVRGPNVTRGYHRDPAATAAALVDGWLRTGDLGFLRSGRLCVTGRHKDVLFVHGRNFHAADLEEVAAGTPGLGVGPVAVVGTTDPESGRERIVVFLAAPAVRADPRVAERVRGRVAEALGYDGVEVRVVPNGTFERTTSGKLRRQALRDRIGAGPAAPAPATSSPRSAPAGRPRTRPEMEQTVRAVWADVLNIPAERIGPDDRFLAIGGSSLAAMEVLAALEDALGRTLDPVLLRDCATVPALADRLLADGAPGRRVAAAPARPPAEIAIIGMACRFPDADTPEQFWHNLLDGRDSVTPATRWPGGGHGAFLADPALFDAAYFGIGDAEARHLDPHARIFLELAHEALERAGYAGPRRHDRRIGVFAAVGESGYPELITDRTGPHALTGSLRNLTAARVAHLLDLRGPALAIDTACSSALVALHVARQSLAAGDCDVAVVGGVNLNLTPTGERLLAEAQALSPTGRCRAFDADADGFVPGEGGAALVLTRLADADGEVLAVVRGTAVNNDGRSLSLLAPNPLVQQEVITEAYRAAGVDPADVTYVEAHGTGTAVGDPIEARSLAHAFPPLPDGRKRLLGSVKTNIGHLLNVAGMPGLLKVILALRHRELPPSLHHERPTPRFDLAGAGFEVVTSRRAWTGPLVAGINSFGFGGTNAHAILSAPLPGSADDPADPPAHPADSPAQSAEPGLAHPGGDGAARPRLLTLSARSAAALRVAATDLAEHLRSHPELREADVCATASTARDDGPYRAAIVADGDLAEQLTTITFGPSVGRTPRVAFLFGGQGTQVPGQGAALYATAPVFRAVLDEVSAAVGPIAGRTLVEWCTDPAVPAADLARTEVTQPLVVAFAAAQAAQLRHFGVRPDAVTGHSVGEFAAAVTAGMLTPAEAVRLAAERGRLTATLAEPGAMLAVAATPTQLSTILGADLRTAEPATDPHPHLTGPAGLVIAAENAADRVVLAGPVAAIDDAVARLTAANIATRRLAVSHAFHSPAMAPVADALRSIAPSTRSAEIPLLSTVTADWSDVSIAGADEGRNAHAGPAFDGDYLAEHALRPVHFAAAADRLRAAGYDTFIEIGASAALAPLIKPATVRAAGTTTRDLLATAGDLWRRGAPLDRTALDIGTRRVALPTYPFQRRRYWPTDPVLSVPHWVEASLPATSATGPVTVLTATTTVVAPAILEAACTEGATTVAASAMLEAACTDAATAMAAAPREGHLLVVTTDLYGDAPDPGHAVWGGLAMALADENPGLGVRVVDLSSKDPEELRRAAVAQESDHPPAPGPAEIVTWRDGRRLRREFVPAPAIEPVGLPTDAEPAGLPADSELAGLPTGSEPAGLPTGSESVGLPTGSRPAGLPADGSYLIIGGAGAAGSAIARHLARRGRPRLLLAGRSAEPSDLLAGLRALGATATYRVADVTAAPDVAALIAGEKFDVVIQAAGIVRPGSLRAKTPAEVTAGLAAKVIGTTLLAEALRSQRPLVIALSSVSSVLPGLAGAVGDYVAGNAYLDAFAAAEQSAGRRFVAVNLPALAGGLAAAHSVTVDALPLDQVPDLLWAAAALGRPQVLVTPGPSGMPDNPRPARAKSHGADAAGHSKATAESEPGAGTRTGAGTGTSPGASTDTDAGTSAHTRTGTSTGIGVAEAGNRSAARKATGTGGAAESGTITEIGHDSLVAIVRELLAGPLGREPEEIGLDESFLSLGLDSLTAVDLVKTLEARLARTLSTTLFFEYRTVGELAHHLAGTTAFPLSPVQLGFHTTSRLYPEVPAYAYVRQTIAGPVDADRLGAAFAELERRHPMLRVRFGAAGQRFSAPGTTGRPAWFTVTDLTGPVHDLDAGLRNRTFDLTREAPVRAVLAVGDGLAHLILVAHHAAADGYSLAILGDELWALYANAGLPAPPRATFADHEAMRTPPTSADLEFWRAELATYPTLRLPFDGDPDAEPCPPYAMWQSRLDPQLSARLNAQARTAGVSLFHLLLAGYVRCLARWTGQESVPVAVARAGRAARLAGLDRMVGPFADTLPVLAHLEPGEPATALAARLREAWLEAERHGSVSTVDLARMLSANGAGPRTATPASFSFARFPGAGATAEHVRETTAGTASAATRLGLVCFEAHGALHFSWNYPEALFDAATVRRFADEHLAEISALAEEPHASVAERIRAQCHRTPAATAVLTDGVPLSYLDLDLASDRLAARLAATGAQRIGLLTGPGAETVIGVVAILKAGAAWVPLDAAHPPARLADQLTRSGARVVVCDATTRDAARALGGFTLVEGRSAPHAAPPPVATGPDDLAYVIFTSGSTGRPKGVPVTHRAMTNYLDWSLETFGYRAGDRLAQTASICFDASVRQLLAPLLVGATVVAWDRDTVRDPAELLKRVERDRVTVWSSVPALWERLLAAAERQRPDLALRWVHVGGEELSPAHVRRWFDLFGPDQRITNLYGPTETTINATFHVISERPADDVTHLPIGRPVGGATVEVVGDDGRECAAGEVGELWIGGAGVAGGYLDDPEQTAAAFVVRAGQRWYRSGDRAARDADGLLWFRGRLDDQVKLHGYRIEPGEVAAVLRGHFAVDAAAVRVDGGRLVAWVQPRGDLVVSGAELRSYLEGLLPAYLVPARIEVMRALPLTATGKIDRGSLPVSATERLLAEVWSRQLGVPHVRRDDDYFALGGDSIGVLDMFAALEADLPVLPRPTVVYRHRTLAALAAAIDEARAEPAAAAVDGAAYPMTLTQRGFLLADRLGTPSTWLAAPRLHGPLDVQRFQRAVDVLVARHPMLRTVFRPPMQQELADVRLEVGYEPDPGTLDDERAVVLDPEIGPLVRLRLLRTGPREHVLLIHAHHLVGDGYSVALLTRELLAVYDRGERALTPLRSTFRDYAALLDRLAPTPVPRDRGVVTVGGTVTTGFTLDTATVAGLRGVATAAGVTPFVPVLAAYHRALARVTGLPDPLIGVAVTGRDHSLPDLGRIFGPCATAVAVRPGDAAGDLRRLADAVAEARTGVFTAPEGWQFFFTYLDFGALGPVEGETLRLTWDEADTELAAPPGTDVLLAVRPIDGGLRLTLRGGIAPELLDRLATGLRTELEAAGASDAAGLDAALVGYLPAPAHLAALAGDLPAEVRAALPRLDRESLRTALFPGNRPRLLEITTTPLGRSGFVCVPRFADELTHGDLAADAAAAADLAAAQGARTVSLAGMIPANTGYGSAVARLVRSAARVTTGHAVTAASVVRTTFAALSARDRRLSGCVLAVVGLGSIGTSSLRLLLDRAGQPPAGLILCDLPAAADRLAGLAAEIQTAGYPGAVEVVTTPDGVYRADVIVAATSGGPGTLDVDRLRPGTILVDDSFPHCFDTARALARMRDRGDVLVVGGGLLDGGPSSRAVADGLPPVAGAGGLPDTIASCRLESLLHAVTPGLPLVCGPVDAAQAGAYWAALDAAGVRAAPLHLLDRPVGT